MCGVLNFKDGGVHKRREDVHWNQFTLSSPFLSRSNNPISYHCLFFFFLTFSFWVEIHYITLLTTKSKEQRNNKDISNKIKRYCSPISTFPPPFTFSPFCGLCLWWIYLYPISPFNLLLRNLYVTNAA